MQLTQLHLGHPPRLDDDRAPEDADRPVPRSLGIPKSHFACALTTPNGGTIPALLEPQGRRLLVHRTHVAAAQAMIGRGVAVDAIGSDLFHSLARDSLAAFGKGQNWSQCKGVRAESLAAMGFDGVCQDRLYQAQVKIPHQFDAGEHAKWCCGPNSAARCSVMLGRSVPNMPVFYERCTRNGFGPLMWGPDPDQLKRYLENCSEFTGIGIGAGKFDRWEEMHACFEWHISHAKTPVIALMIWGQFTMHWLCVVGISKDKQKVIILNTDCALLEMPMAQIRHEMENDVLFDKSLRKFNCVRFWP